MSLALWLAAVAGIGLALRRYLNHRYQRLAASQGCQPAVRYRHWDPWFGLDIVFSELYGVLTNTNLLTLTSKLDQYGSTFATETLGAHAFWSKDPELIEAIWSTQGEKWGNEPYRRATMEPFCGLGIITADGPAWEHSRALLKPTFAKANVSDLSFLEQATTSLIARIPKDGGQVDLQHLLYEMFLDIASKFVFNESMGVTVGDKPKNTAIPANTFLAEFHNSLQGIGLRFVFGSLRDFLPRASWDRSCNAVHRFVESMIDNCTAKRKFEVEKEGASHVSPDSKHYHSLIEGLILRTNDRVEARNQLIQAMLAAQETVSVLTANTMYLLARHPAVWKRVRLEAAALNAQGFAMDNLLGSKLLQNVLKESLRLYPVFPNMARAALTTTTLPRGGGPDGKSPLFIPKGSHFSAVFYALYRNPAIFGHDTEAFDPDRWNSIAPRPFEYMPFGRGRRRCLGQDKALVEAAYIVCRIAEQFESVVGDGSSYAAAERVTTRNARGCVLRFGVA